MIKRAKKNKYQPTADSVLDLHGLIAVEAETALTNFLLAARQAGFKRVRLITGKGINSLDGRAVLKPLVETWLKERGYNWRPAKINDGGEGAVDVDLVNK